jgi:hypothetical protein
MDFAAGSVRDVPVRALKLCGLTWSGEFLWFSEAVSNQIIAVDSHTGEVLHRVGCPEVRTDLTTMDGHLVQVSGNERCLRVIDPETGRAVTELPNPRPGHQLCGLEATARGLWMGYQDLHVVDLRDRSTLALIASFKVRNVISGLTVSDGYLAYADYRAGTINLIDLDAGREVAAYSVAGNPTGITWDGIRIWYCDHTTLQLRAIEVPGILKD